MFRGSVLSSKVAPQGAPSHDHKTLRVALAEAAMTKSWESFCDPVEHSHAMSEEDKKDLHKLFRALDNRGELFLNREDISRVLSIILHQDHVSKKDIGRMVHALDHDGDGQVDMEEFRAVLTVLNQTSKIGSMRALSLLREARSHARKVSEKVVHASLKTAKVFGADLDVSLDTPYDVALLLNCRIEPGNDGHRLVQKIRSIGLICRVWRIEAKPTSACCCCSWCCAEQDTTSTEYCPLPCWKTFRNDMLLVTAEEGRLREIYKATEQVCFFAGMDLVDSVRDPVGEPGSEALPMSRSQQDECVARLLAFAGIVQPTAAAPPTGEFAHVLDKIVWLQDLGTNQQIMRELFNPTRQEDLLADDESRLSGDEDECCGCKHRNIRDVMEHFPSFLTADAIDRIRDQFGDKIAWYYAFLRHFCTWLFYLCLCSILFGTYNGISGYTTGNGYRNDRDGIWSPDPSRCFAFAIFTQVWASVMMRMWKRTEAWWQVRWGQVDMDRFEAVASVRPGYKSGAVVRVTRAGSPTHDSLSEEELSDSENADDGGEYNGAGGKHDDATRSAKSERRFRRRSSKRGKHVSIVDEEKISQLIDLKTLAHLESPTASDSGSGSSWVTSTPDASPDVAVSLSKGAAAASDRVVPFEASTVGVASDEAAVTRTMHSHEQDGKQQLNTIVPVAVPVSNPEGKRVGKVSPSSASAAKTVITEGDSEMTLADVAESGDGRDEIGEFKSAVVDSPTGGGSAGAESGATLRRRTAGARGAAGKEEGGALDADAGNQRWQDIMERRRLKIRSISGTSLGVRGLTAARQRRKLNDIKMLEVVQTDNKNVGHRIGAASWNWFEKRGSQAAHSAGAITGFLASKMSGIGFQSGLSSHHHQMTLELPRTLLFYAPRYLFSFVMSAIFVGGATALVVIFNAMQSVLFRRKRHDPCLPVGFDNNIPLFKAFPDIGLALLVDVVMYELLKVVAPVLTDVENHRTSRNWETARFKKIWAFYYGGVMGYFAMIAFVFVPFGDEIVTLGSMFGETDSRPTWSKVQSLCNITLSLNLSTCTNWQAQGVVEWEDTPLWHSTGLTPYKWERCWLRHRADDVRSSIQNFVTIVMLVNAVVTMLLPFLLDRILCCGGCKARNVQEASVIEVFPKGGAAADEDEGNSGVAGQVAMSTTASSGPVSRKEKARDDGAARKSNGNPRSRLRSRQSSVRIAAERMAAVQEAALTDPHMLQRVIKETQGETGKTSPYDVDDNWMWMMRCLSFLCIFIPVWPIGMPLVFLAYFVLQSRTDACRLMFQRSKPVPERVGGIQPFESQLHLFLNISHWLNMAVVFVTVDCRPDWLADLGGPDDNLLPYWERKETLYKLIIGFCVVMLEKSLINFFCLCVPAVPGSISLQIRFLKVTSRRQLWQMAVKHTERKNSGETTTSSQEDVTG